MIRAVDKSNILLTYFFFPTCFIGLNRVQTLSGTVMERIWTTSHVCFLISTSKSRYCSLTFLAATLCFFLCEEKLCGSSLCRWMCVDDASLPCCYLLPGCSLLWASQQGGCSSMHVPALGSITRGYHECTFLLHSCSPCLSSGRSSAEMKKSWGGWPFLWWKKINKRDVNSRMISTCLAGVLQRHFPHTVNFCSAWFGAGTWTSSFFSLLDAVVMQIYWQCLAWAC